MEWIWIGLAGGVAAFAHCLGMCGGFALHLAQGEGRGGILARQMLWHLGRITTYVFLGAMAGFLGGWLIAPDRWPWLQNVLAYVTGGVMILMGLAMAGLLPHFGRPGGAREGGLLSSLFSQFFARPTPAAALILGIATGFLPCPIVLGFLTLAVQRGSVAIGMAMMAAMGVGTMGSLLVLGLTGHMLALRLRRWGAVAGGAVLVLLGLATGLRGTEVFHQILGCPSASASAVAPASPDEPAAPPCCCGHTTPQATSPQSEAPQAAAPSSAAPHSVAPPSRSP